MIRVRNMPDSSKIYVDQPDGKSWINWWKSKSGIDEDTNVNCCLKDCGEIAEGAHVIPINETNPVWVMPLCHAHNTDPDLVVKVNDNSKLLIVCPDKYKKN